MKQQMLYRELAKYYDLIYSWKDYRKEANQTKKLISKYKESAGRELLDVACGTGHHLKYLKNNFSCIGIDINKEMLDIAKKNLTGVVLKKGNMLNFDINKKFDVITCLFGSITYVKTYKNLKRAISNFYKHLKKGGVAIIEGWISKSEFREGHIYMNTYDGTNIKIVRIGTSKIKNRGLVEADMHHLIGEKGKKIKYFAEKHELALFEDEKMLEILKEVGFKAKFVKKCLMKDRGLFIGIKK